MHTSSCVRWRLAVLAVACFLPGSMTAADPPDKERPPTAVERVQKALNETVTIKIDGGSLTEAVDALHEKTKINFVLDTLTIEKTFGWSPDKPPTLVTVDLKDVKIKAVLRTILPPYSLSYALVGHALAITPQDLAFTPMMRQPLNPHFHDL